MKKAIIFECIDNFNNEYRYVVVTEIEKIKDVVKEEMRLSTEIIDYEVVNCYEH